MTDFDKLTPEQVEKVSRLRSVLPAIAVIDGTAAQPGSWFDGYPLDERVIDLEWHSERCRCGRDLPAGALEMIGIGNDQCAVQVDWQALNDFARIEVRADVEALVRTGVTIYHNAAADIEKMRENGFAVTAAGHARLEDTMLADSVLHSEEDHDLGDLNDRLGRLPEWKSLAQVAPDVYNAADLAGTYLIWKHGLLPRLQADPAAFWVYRSMSIPFLDIAIEGEEAGIRTNPEVGYRLLDKYGERVAQGRALARAYTGDLTFNIASPDQLKHWLYNCYGLPIQREKSHGQDEGKATTDKDAIAALRRLHGTEWDEDDEPTLAQALANIEDGGHGLLEAKHLFSGAQQRLTHYVYPCFVTEGKGEERKVIEPRVRIYPRCKIHGQASGRVGYVEPALPQMKGDVLDLIVPDPGTVWVGHDWSNVETWLLGGLANDPVILAAKEKGWDTHVLNYCDMTGTPYPAHLTKAVHTCECEGCRSWRLALHWMGADDLRRTFAKRFVYRLHYRGKAENAGDIPGARALKFDADRLVAASERYLAKHEPIVEFWKGIEHAGDTAGVVYTFMGRPRRSTNPYRNARNRELSNHPMQGGVADIYVTTALLVKAAAPWARLVYGAYDSMFWQVPTERQLEFTMIYAPIVERPFNVCGREMSFPASYKIKEAA